MAAAAADLAERTVSPAAAVPAAAAPATAGRADRRRARPRSRAPRSERLAARARRPAPGSCASPRSSRSSRLVGWNVLLQNQLNASQAYEQSVAAVLEVAAQPGSLTAILTPDDGTGSGLAAVSADGTVTLAMQDLAPTTGSTVYTAWAIGGDGVPVAIGDFTVGSDGTASLRARRLSPLASGTLLALTREPARGATTPTLPIVSKGVATAPA